MYSPFGNRTPLRQPMARDRPDNRREGQLSANSYYYRTGGG
jgi:hypothetical protein